MQKKLIALAIAGLASSAAFAQSNVTIYGVADMYAASARTSGDTRTLVNSGGLSGSRLGFRGEEDLGNGLKAVFTLEYALAVDGNAGVGTAGARQQFVGLAGGFGTVVAGRLQTPGYGLSVKYDPLAGSGALSAVGNLTRTFAAGSISAVNANARVNNGIAYVSPNISGLVTTVAYAVGETNTSGAAVTQNVVGLSADYSNGPIAVGFGYHAIANIGNAPSPDSKEMFLGASYDLGMAKLFATYQNEKINNAAGLDPKDSVWSLGAVMPVGAGNVHVSYASLTDGGTAAANPTNTDSKQYTLAYTHGLSKRTTVYTGYSRISNENAVGNNISGLGLAVAAGKNGSVLAAGIRHTF